MNKAKTPLRDTIIILITLTLPHITTQKRDPNTPNTQVNGQIGACKEHSPQNANECILCQDNYFLDNSNERCLPCSQLISHCKECNTQRICLDCVNGYHLIRELEMVNGVELEMRKCERNKFFSSVYWVLIVAIGPFILSIVLVAPILYCFRKRPPRPMNAKEKAQINLLGNILMNGKVSPVKKTLTEGRNQANQSPVNISVLMRGEGNKPGEGTRRNQPRMKSLKQLMAEQSGPATEKEEMIKNKDSGLISSGRHHTEKVLESEGNQASSQNHELEEIQI